MTMRAIRHTATLLSGMLLAATAAAQATDATAPDAGGLRPSEALLVLDYQVIRVAGDAPIDLMGLHVHQKIADPLYLGAGVYAPLVRGQYGGFTAWDVGAHLKHPLGEKLFATAGLFAGGGGGGRTIEQSKVLTGTGRFYKAYVGLGYDLGGFSVGANVSRLKFTGGTVDGTQANVFVEFPYTTLIGPFAKRGEPLSPADTRAAAEAAGENLFTATLDNLKQIDPQGTNKGTIHLVDLQFSHFIGRDTYGFASVGVGYKGLPLYNHVMGGLGQRWPLAPNVNVYTQLGIGSGGYAPGVIDTDAGLIVAPKVSAEVALTRNLGVALSAGYLAAPKGSSRNWSLGLALTNHLRAGSPDAGGTPTYQPWRIALFQQTETSVRYRDIDRGRLQLLGAQADLLLDERWYVPLQAAVAHTAYLGYPGYGELLGGIGVQTRTDAGERLQGFAQLMAGANVHGPAVKASVGGRYLISDRLALQASAGQVRARGSSGGRFSANALAIGLDYRFTVPGW